MQARRAPLAAARRVRAVATLQARATHGGATQTVAEAEAALAAAVARAEAAQQAVTAARAPDGAPARAGALATTAAYIARLTRLGMLEQLSADYIRTARAKGVPESRVILKHALKNAFLPVLSFLGPATAYAMTGSFVVERVFTVPGMGQHFVAAVQNKDLFLIIGVVMIYAAMLVLFNLAVDVLYRWVDPRIQ